MKVLADKLEEALLLVCGNLTTMLADSLAEDAAHQSQATRLIEMVSDVEFFHSSDGEAFATVRISDHLETVKIKARGFRRFLMRRYYEQTGSSPSAQAIQDAIGVLEGKAIFDGAELPVFLRIAEQDGKIYLDLANSKWEVVEITPEGWHVVANSPVKFRRVRGLLALPSPEGGGSITDLRRFVNVGSDDDWILLCAWLVQSLRPRGPYPMGVLHGKQGSAKSTTERALRALIDPNSSPLRTEPRNEHDLMIAASNGWCVALDNLSTIPIWLADAICRLATGGGFSARELYSDSDEVLFDAQRPVLLNGIEELATRGDLLDRSIIFYQPSIPEENRQPESAFWSDFETARPRILGALLHAVSVALRKLHAVKLDRLPRMADFALWATAAEEAFAFEPSAFINAYRRNRDSAKIWFLNRH